MLTKRQKSVLVFVQNYQKREGGVSPSRQDIADGLAIKSKGNISVILDALEERGFIRRLAGHARAIEVLRPAIGGTEPPRASGSIPIYDADTNQLRGYL